MHFGSISILSNVIGGETSRGAYTRATRQSLLWYGMSAERHNRHEKNNSQGELQLPEKAPIRRTPEIWA